MATLICVTSCVHGILYPGVELSRRLAADGHRVIFTSFREARQLVEDQGLRFAELEPSRYPDFLAEDSRLPFLERLRRLGPRRARALGALGVTGLAERFRREAPDLILVDGEMHEHVIALTAVGVPIVLLNAFSSIWRRPGLPPLDYLARPGVGFKGSRLGTWLLWRALRLRKWRTARARWIKRAGCDRLSLLHGIARGAGFDLRRETDPSQWLIPFTYRRLPVLSLHALEFDFAHRPPRRVRYVGPMLLEKRGGDRPVPEADLRRLEALFEHRRRQGSRLIYAGFGTFFATDLDFVRRLAEAVAGRPDWRLVLSLGGQIEPKDVGELGERAHVFRWLPQPKVVREADAVITHGGINTLDECVLSAVPMLLYCGRGTDMAGNTSRVVHHGIGLAGDRKRDTPAVIRRRILRLLEEPAFSRRIRRMRESYLAYTRDRVAERAVRELLASEAGR